MSTYFIVEFRENHFSVLHCDSYSDECKSEEEVWKTIGELDKKVRCGKVVAQLSTADFPKTLIKAYNFGAQACSCVQGIKLAIVCEKNDETGDFLKTVILNRGGFVEYFSNEEEALRWLGI